jgi:mono/diheme cytochrome c family protein
LIRLIAGAVAAAALFTTVNATAQGVERGRYLMQGIVACGNCHTPKGPQGDLPGMEMAGGFEVDEPGVFTAISPNITPDPDTGIGKWTDAQIISAIREGKRPDGSIIGPPMPIGLYRGMSDSDVKSIVAYLRQVKPIRNEVKKSVYKIPLPPAYGPPVVSVPDVPKTDKVKYGAYLAGPLGHCMDCHTPMLADGRLDLENRAGVGGRKFDVGPLGIAVSRNLTPDPKNGLGGWTDEQIKQTIKTGKRPNGEPLKPPMAFPYYAHISDDDYSMLITYLRSLKPLAGP